MKWYALSWGERHLKSKIRTEIVAMYIADKSALKIAYRRASSVGVMLLVAGGTNGEAHSCSRSVVRLSACVRRHSMHHPSRTLVNKLTCQHTSEEGHYKNRINAKAGAVCITGNGTLNSEHK